MQMAPNFVAKRPHVAEFDLAGVIVDQKCSDFKIGDNVIAWTPPRESMFCMLFRFHQADLTEKRKHSRLAKALFLNTRVSLLPKFSSALPTFLQSKVLVFLSPVWLP